MAKIHNCKNQLSLKYENLVFRRRLSGNLLYIALIILASMALLYAIRNPWDLQEWISDCYWNIVPKGGFLVSMIMVACHGLTFVVWLLLYPLLVFLIFFCISRLRQQNHGKESQEEAILRAGLEGEERLRSILSHLPDCCHIYTNVNIPWRDSHGNAKNSETDVIVVSPSGIFIVEAKNYQGRICGKVSDENLIHEKYRGEKLISQKEFYNPVKQVKTHARALSWYLKKHGLSSNVKTCVFFSNEDVELAIEGSIDTYSDCPVYAANNLYGFGSFFYFKYRCIYNDEELDQILQVMDTLIHEPDNAD